MLISIIIFAIAQGNANAFIANYFASSFLYYGTLTVWPLMVKNGFKRTLNTLLGHSTGLFMAWSLLVLALPTRQYLSPSAAAGGFVLWAILLLTGSFKFTENTYFV